MISFERGTPVATVYIPNSSLGPKSWFLIAGVQSWFSFSGVQSWFLIVVSDRCGAGGGRPWLLRSAHAPRGSSPVSQQLMFLIWTGVGAIPRCLSATMCTGNALVGRVAKYNR